MIKRIFFPYAPSGTVGNHQRSAVACGMDPFSFVPDIAEVSANLCVDVAQEVLGIVAVALSYINPVNINVGTNNPVNIQVGDTRVSTTKQNQQQVNVTAGNGNDVTVTGAPPQKDVHKKEQFTATAGQTVFNTAFEIRSNSENVYLNGILQQQGVSYTINSGAQGITFAVALELGDKVEIDYVVA